jgi:hypothetical protein
VPALAPRSAATKGAAGTYARHQALARKAKRGIPPPPPIPTGPPRRKLALQPQVDAGMTDTAGRSDLAGRSTSFYPSARSLNTDKTQTSGIRTGKPKG